MEASTPPTGLGLESEPSEAPCDTDEENMPCPDRRTYPAHRRILPGPSRRGLETPPPDVQPHDLSNPHLMMASEVSSTGKLGKHPARWVSVRRTRRCIRAGYLSFYPRKVSLETPIVAGHTSTAAPTETGLIPEPVRMVSSPNPYAYLPSLYDLYMQAAPRTGRLERFGLDVFRRDRRLARSGFPWIFPRARSTCSDRATA